MADIIDYSDLTDLDFIKFFMVKSNYEEYADLYDLNEVRQEPLAIFKSLENYYNTNADIKEVSAKGLMNWFLQFNADKITAKMKETYIAVFKLIHGRPKHIKETILKGMAQKKAARDLTTLAGKMIDTEQLRDIADKVDRATAKDDEIEARRLVKSLNETLTECAVTNGYSWNIEFLQKVLGPMPYRGMFMVVGGRPEACKTSWLVSTLTNFAKQLNKGEKILWFVNEGMTERLQNRCASAVLGKTATELTQAAEDGVDMDEEYLSNFYGENPFLIYEISGVSYAFLHRVIKKHKDCIKLIAVDMLDHVGLANTLKNGGNSDMYYGALYQWFLGIAIQYCSVIGTSQISKIYEDKGGDSRHPKLEDLTQSKTLKQGAAQAIIMIGQKEGCDTRYLNIRKNKFGPGGTDVCGTVLFDRQLCNFS